LLATTCSEAGESSSSSSRRREQILLNPGGVNRKKEWNEQMKRDNIGTTARLLVQNA